MMRLAATCLIALGVAAGCVQPGSLADTQGASAPASLAVAIRLLDENQPEMAIDAFSRVIANEGVSAEALVGLGVAYHRTGRQTASVRMFEAGVDFDPNSAEARNNLGVAYYMAEEYVLALSEFERAFAITGGADPTVRFNLGVAEVALASRAEQVEVDDANFDVIQYGHGVFRLEERERGATTPPEQSETGTEARS